MTRHGRVIVCALALAAAWAPRAHAAQAVSGFPYKLDQPITTPVTAVTLPGEAAPRLYAATTGSLVCVTLAAKECDGFPVAFGETVVAAGLPAFGDLDGDKKLEVALALSDGRLLVRRADSGAAVAGFAFRADAGFEAGPAIADLDDDGRGELVVGSREGKLFALKVTGQPVKGFPVLLGGSITSAPSVGLLGKPQKVAIVAGSEDGKVYAVDASGQALAGFPLATQYMVSGQPALGDLDGDGANEVVVASQDAKIYASRATGQGLLGFPASLGARLLAGPALAAVLGDGTLQIVAGATDGRLHALGGDGKPLGGFPVKLGEKLVGGAVVADLDRDGRPEIVAATADGLLHALKATGKPFTGYPTRLGAEPVGGPAVVEAPSEGGVIVAQAAGDRIFVFKVKRAGKAAEPHDWPLVGHDAARTGRRFPNAPGYADLLVEPTAPSATDEIKATYRFFDVDGDPEPATEIRWWRNGREAAELSGKRTVPRGAAKKKEKWKFSVAAPGGVLRPSAEVVVANSRPSAPKIALEPPALRRCDAARVRLVEESKDADGDKVTYAYAWLKDGQPQPGLTKVELPAGTVKKGERWSVVVTPSDGEADGPPATLEATAQDSPPTAPQVSLTPESPKTGDIVRGVIRRGADDPDGDALSYRTRWLVDGAPLPLGVRVDTLPPMTLRKKQSVLVEVQADDGTLVGPVATARATVANTPPSAPVAAASPAVPRRGDSLVAGLAAPSTDADGDRVTYRFVLSKDGKRLASPEAPDVRKGEVYEVEAVASDGESETPGAKVVVKVGNAPPTRPVVAFERLPLRRAEPVKVKVVEPAADADGDALTYRYAWLRGGEPQASLTGPELPAGTLKKGERWAVVVRAFDGEAEGPPATAEAVVADSPPSAPAVELAPAAPRVGDPIRVVVKREAVDADGDKLTRRIRFFVDGTPQVLPPDADALPERTARKKQVVSVEVVADDGELASQPAKAQVTVVNTPPEAPRVVLVPSSPRRGDLLLASLLAPSVDADGDSVTYHFTFFRDGKKVAGQADGRALADLKKREAIELEVVASDGEADSVPERLRAKVVDTPPSAPAVSVVPEAPRAGEAVETKLDRPSVDPDGDPVVYAYAWAVNGKPAGLAKEARGVPANRTRKHEVWTVDVTPSDGELPGPVGRARVEVENTPPTAPKIVIEPVEPTAETGAKARLVAPSSDRDGDVVAYRYAWTRDGARIDLPPDAAAVPAGLLRRDEALRLVVVASDGEAESQPATAVARVKNSPPTAPGVAIVPEKPTVRDALTCAIRVPTKDPDREEPLLRFAWFRDGQRVSTASELDKVPAGVARRGETWACEVVATDGGLASPKARAEVRVANSLPTAPGVAIEPEQARSGQDLRCRVVQPSEDADGDPVSYVFRWTQGEKPAAVDPRDATVLPLAGIKKGVAYRCEVTPSDPEGKGPSASAQGVLENVPPGPAVARLEPKAPTAGGALRCEVAEASSDPDGDAVRYKFRWTKNGVEQSFGDTSAQVPARLVKAGDIWKCAVIPTDGSADGPASESAEVIVLPAQEAGRSSGAR